MKAFDVFLALVGLVGFAAFLGIIAYFVPQPVLVLVMGLGVLMAAYDFARDLFFKD